MDGKGTAKILRPPPPHRVPLPLPRLSSIRRLGRLSRRVAGGLVSIAYPPLCLGCEARLPDPADALCATCLRGLPRADAEAVARLFTTTPAVQGAVALWAFDPGGTVRRLQHALKYAGRPALGQPLGRTLGLAVRQAGLPIDAVVPTPLGRLRQLERGYNQAAALADGVAEALGVPHVDVLQRTRPTRSQAALSKAARRRNVDGAFALAPDVDITGRRVLLVDDVLTTGATLAAAARPLTDAGARVSVAALALAGT